MAKPRKSRLGPNVEVVRVQLGLQFRKNPLRKSNPIHKRQFMPTGSEEEINRLRQQLEEVSRERDDPLKREASLRSALTNDRQEGLEIVERPSQIEKLKHESSADIPPRPRRQSSITLPNFSQPRLNRSFTATSNDSIAIQPRSRRTWSLEIPRESSSSNTARRSELPNLTSAFLRQGSGSVSRQSSISLQSSGALSRQSSFSRNGSLSRQSSSDINLPPPDYSHRFPVRVAQRSSNAHEGEIFGIACSVDGALVATGGDDRRIRVHTMLTSSSPEYIKDTTQTITTLAFLSHTNGKDHTPLLCAGTSKGEVHVYKRNTRKSKWDLSRVLPVHGSSVRRLLPGQDIRSTTVLSASSDRKLILTDVNFGKELWSASTHSPIFDASMLHSGTGEVVCGHKDGQLRIYCPRQRSIEVDGVINDSARVHSKAAISLTCLDDGFGVISLGRDNVIKLSDLRMNAKVIKEFERCSLDTVSDWHRICVDENVVYAGLGYSGRLGTWNAKTGEFDRALSTLCRPTVRDYEDLSAKRAVVSEVLVPYWTSSGQFVCVHQQKQLSFWESKTRRSRGTYL